MPDFYGVCTMNRYDSLSKHNVENNIKKVAKKSKKTTKKLATSPTVESDKKFTESKQVNEQKSPTNSKNVYLKSNIFNKLTDEHKNQRNYLLNPSEEDNCHEKNYNRPRYVQNDKTPDHQRQSRRNFRERRTSSKTDASDSQRHDLSPVENSEKYNYELNQRKTDDMNLKQQLNEDGENQSLANDIQQPVLMSLDEWKAKQAERIKPQFNIRKAGEGEKKSKWGKMVLLPNKKEQESEDEWEYDPSMYPQRRRNVKNIDIDFKRLRRSNKNNKNRRLTNQMNDEEAYAPELDDRNFPALS